MPRYTRASGSSSSSATRSFTLWIEALTGPSSTTSPQISAMKRPSEVPPVQEISGRIAQTSCMASFAASTSLPRGVLPSLLRFAA